MSESKAGRVNGAGAEESPDEERHFRYLTYRDAVEANAVEIRPNGTGEPTLRFSLGPDRMWSDRRLSDVKKMLADLLDSNFSTLLPPDGQNKTMYLSNIGGRQVNGYTQDLIPTLVAVMRSDLENT